MSNKIAISVDLEDWYHSSHVMGNNITEYEASIENLISNWDTKYDYITPPTLRLLKIFKYFDVKATFFIVADIAQVNPKLIELISMEGHEIASHSLHHSEVIDKFGNPRMSKDDFRKSTKLSKQILEGLSNKKVIGYRSPGAWIAGWMLDVLEDIGFSYDSSVCINSFYSKMDKVPIKVETSPYYPAKGSLEKADTPRKIVEHPWTYWSSMGLKFPSQGGPLLRYMGSNYIIKGLNESLLRGDTMFYLHPLDISHRFPRNISRRNLFWYGRGKAAEKSLIKIVKEFPKSFVKHSSILNK